MKSFGKSAAAATVFFLTTGCAGVCHKSEAESKVIERQSSVLRKIVELRESENFKKRLEVDPVLVEQERVLMAGVNAVIQSDDSIRGLECKTKKCGGSIGK